MIIGHMNNLEAKKSKDPSTLGTSMKTAIGAAEGWEDYVLRFVELEEGGHTPRHNHDWPHINYIIEGEGAIFMSGSDTKVSAGSYAYIPSNTEHQFMNKGKGKLKFICIVPKRGHK